MVIGLCEVNESKIMLIIKIDDALLQFKNEKRFEKFVSSIFLVKL